MITLQKIKNIINSKGWSYFTNGKYNLNIVAIRADNMTANSFDDYITVSYKDANNIERFHIFPGTTDPGTYWMNNPMNVKGAAIVKPGRYNSLWSIGTHFTYTALVQVGNITVWRDNNKDNILDQTAIEETGLFGINLHRADSIYPGQSVDKYSAGCQVIADPKDFDRMMELCKLQVKNKSGNTFSYTLLEEKDFS